MYPNPAKSKITITSAAFQPGETQISIFDLSGRELSREQFRDKIQIEIDVSSFPSGIYLVKIQTRDYNEIKKMVIDWENDPGALQK